MNAVDPQPADQPNEATSRKNGGRREWGSLVRLAYRDPEHVSERLTLRGARQLGEPSRKWAERLRDEQPDAPRALIAEDLRSGTARASWVDGAISGTPFLIALVPGYLAFLWQEGIMERRVAALYGHDPEDLETSAQILVLRGVHPTADAAREALLAVRDVPAPEKPAARRPLRVWVRSLYLLLVFGGFVSAEEDTHDKYAHWRLKAVLGSLFGLAIFITTWVLPLTFMLAMAWGCEAHARKLGSRTMSFYGGQSAGAEAAIAAADRQEEQGRGRRDFFRGVLIVLSVAVPIAFVAYADHVRQSTGVNLLGILGALVAVSLVIAVTVVVSRR